jgi:hypothetical protein
MKLIETIFICFCKGSTKDCSVVTMEEVAFDHIFSPLNKTSKILGIFPYKFKNGILTHSKLGIFQMCVYSIVYIALAIFYSKTFASTSGSEFANLKVIQYSAILQRIGYSSLTLIGFVSMSFCHRKLVEARNSVRKVDTDLMQLGHTDISSNEGQIRRKLIVLIVSLYLFVAILPAILTSSAKAHNKGVTFIVLLYPRLVATNLNIHFYIFTILAEARFKAINNIVQRKHSLDLHFCDKVQQLLGLHRSLIRACKVTNVVYSPHLLLCIALSFACLVGNINYVIYFFLRGSYSTYAKAFSGMVLNSLVHASHLHYVTKRASNLCFEVNRIEDFDYCCN